MKPVLPPQTHTQQQDPDWLVGLGGWLFTWRTSIPLPIVVLLLAIPSSAPAWRYALPGSLVIAAGELLRLWAVRQIGVISRTRSDRLGPLVSTGPFGFVRNPLYLGNIALWAGFSLCAGLPWLALPIVAALGFVYHAIVRWEERLLESRLGASYRDYMTRVPRWLPSLSSREAAAPDSEARFSWRDTLFSERGTLIAIAAGYALLWAKFAI